MRPGMLMCTCSAAGGIGLMCSLCGSQTGHDRGADQVYAIRVWLRAAGDWFGGGGPFGQQAIGRQAGVERIRPRAIHVHLVGATGRAQDGQVDAALLACSGSNAQTTASSAISRARRRCSNFSSRPMPVL